MKCESIFSNENNIKCENEAKYTIRVKELDIFSLRGKSQLNICDFHKKYYETGFDKGKIEIKRLKTSSEDKE